MSLKSLLKDTPSSEKKQLHELFKVLKKINCPYNKENELFYKKIIAQGFYASDLVKLFEELSASGFVYSSHQKLYEKIVGQAFYAKNISKGLSHFRLQGITYPESRRFFFAIFKDPRNADYLARAFVALYQANESVPHLAYREILKSAPFAAELSYAFKALAKSGFLLKDHLNLYINVIINGKSARAFTSFCTRLRVAGYYGEDFLELYTGIADNPCCGEELLTLFEILSQAGLAVKDAKPIHSLVFNDLFKVYSLVDSFRGLVESDFIGLGAMPLYMVALHQDDEIGLVSAFRQLKEIGLGCEQAPELYQRLMRPLKEEHFARIKENFAQLERLNCHYSQDNVELYMKALFGGCLSLKLLKCGFNPENESHTAFFINTFKHCKTNDSSMINKMLTVTAVKQLAKKEFDVMDRLAPEQIISLVFDISPEHQKQQFFLMACIKRAIKQTQHPYGPLNKTMSTKALENIVYLMLDAKPKDIRLRRDHYKEYQLSIFKSANKEIRANLSLLIKNANMTHFNLSDEALIKLDKRVLELCPQWKHPVEAGEGPLALLPESLRKALNFYTYEDKCYRDINRLFRGEELLGDNVIGQPNQSSDYVLICFFIGCLLEVAVNRLPVLLDEPEVFQAEKIILHKIAKAQQIDLRKINDKKSYQSLLEKAFKESQITGKEHGLLSGRFVELCPLMGGYPFLLRVELLKEETMRIREANVLSLPALTSATSKKAFGHSFFKSDQKHRLTRFENVPTNAFSLDSLSEVHGEAEVLISAGTQVQTTRVEKNYMVRRIINSPAFQTDNYWSDFALRYADKHYLSKRYKDMDETIDIGGKFINRPNHGMAHSYRVMNYIEPVIQYFALYAKDESFIAFCQSLSPLDIQWLKIAAAFRVTGRESEVGFSDDPVRYLNYRQASAEHFAHFVKEINPFSGRYSNLKNALQEVIHYMGNPHYESSLNTGADENEKSRRNYLMRILSMAHNLDLARCHTADAYQDSLDRFADFVVPGEEQHLTLKLLVAYAISLINSHGSSLFCKLDEKHEIVDYYHGYKSMFAAVSHSVKTLFDRTRKVPTIAFEEMDPCYEACLG